MICLIMLSLSLSACGSAAGPEPSSDPIPAAVPSFPPLPQSDGFRVAVASDLHLNPDNRPSAENVSAAAYSPELVDALLWDAQHQGADLLLLTGDLCNGGRLYRHEALTEKLRQAEADGLPVLILPGNHDLAPITQTEFAALYEEFGFAEACSRDTASLSYCVMDHDLMILMMDTAGYSVGTIDLPGAPAPAYDHPFFTDTTLRWAESMLQKAKREGLHVLVAGHYNLLPEISRDPESSGYYLENGDRFADLLRKYGVPLYLSGHMHTRYVYQEAGLTELLTEYLLAYPTAYSMLDLTEDSIRYTPRRIDVDAWAAESGQTDPVLLNFAQWQQDQLLDYSVHNIEYMSERNPLDETQRNQAAAFFYRVINDFWQGTLAGERSALEAMPGYEPFFRCAEGYAYGWWLKDLISNANALSAGFTLTWP